MPSILFVCTANRFRSPIAAIYFARSVVKQGDDNFITVSSAGTWTVPDQPVTTEALLEADKYALNLSLHKSRLITRAMLSKTDLILVMENNQKEALCQEFPDLADRIYLLTEVVKGRSEDVPDPYGTEEPAADVAAEIVNLIDQGYDQIIKLARMNTTRS
ncbi:MAG TPA: hypothetical protein PLE10_03670 [Brevefilum sp.]|nr:hypothetical protein [Brevefilum sp.]HOR18912.1 hypothetical protein [Brevefilum sp.]HPL70007.1 hypothetical protein [Brevefilum sp.]